MAYDPNAHVPFVVIGVWVCALIGLGAYFVTYYVADLSKWVHGASRGPHAALSATGPRAAPRGRDTTRPVHDGVRK